MWFFYPYTKVLITDLFIMGVILKHIIYIFVSTRSYPNIIWTMDGDLIFNQQ